MGAFKPMASFQPSPARGSAEEARWPADDGPSRIVVFDLETEAWDTFVVGGILTQEGHYEEHDSEKACWEALWREGAVPGTEIYAWNGGRFDFLWGLEIARERCIVAVDEEDKELGADIGLAGTRVTRIQWKQGTTKGPLWKDACALIPLSLARAAAIAGVTVVKDTGLSCICGSTCGGYCSIKRGMGKRARAVLSRYLRLDCVATLAIVQAVRDEAKRSAYTLKGTIGGTAYATARKTCGFKDAEWEPRSYSLARSGYFGGRVEVYRPSADSGHAYDINSAYPAALVKTAIPCGERVTISGDRAERAFGREKEGIYVADVKVPDCFVPPLPVRLGQRVLFPIGPIAGAWTRIELAEAIACGATVQRWGRAIVWEDSKKVLAPFMRQAWGRRSDAIRSGNDGLKEWHKLVANSFTGKCAQQPEMERVLLNPPHIKQCDATSCEFPSRAICERRRRGRLCCLHTCTRACGAFRAMDRKGKLWTSAFYRIPDCGHVHWAAYLTAATRIELRRQALSDGAAGQTMVYCDTDSVYSVAPRTHNIGDELGEWKSEGAFTDWECASPKVYKFTRGDKVKVKAKGLPDLDGESWERFVAGEKVRRDRGVKSLKSAAQGDSLFARKEIARQSRADGKWFGGRRLGSDGRTYPVTIKEFEESE